MTFAFTETVTFPVAISTRHKCIQGYLSPSVAFLCHTQTQGRRNPVKRGLSLRVGPPQGSPTQRVKTVDMVSTKRARTQAFTNCLSSGLGAVPSPPVPTRMSDVTLRRLPQSPSKLERNVELMAAIEKALVASEQMLIPCVYVSSDVEKSEREKLREIVRAHGGTIAGARGWWRAMLTVELCIVFSDVRSGIKHILQYYEVI